MGIKYWHYKSKWFGYVYFLEQCFLLLIMILSSHFKHKYKWLKKVGLKVGALMVGVFCTDFKSSRSTQLANWWWVWLTILPAVMLFSCEEHGNFWNEMLYSCTEHSIISSLRSWSFEKSVVQSLSDTYSRILNTSFLGPVPFNELKKILFTFNYNYWDKNYYYIIISKIL